MRGRSTSFVLAASCLATVALARHESQVATRGYRLSGELLIYAPPDQRLPAGWKVQSSSACGERATSVELDGTCDVRANGDRIVALASRALSARDSPLALRGPEQSIALAELQLRLGDGKCVVRTRTDELAGRAVLEFVGDVEPIETHGEGSFALHGELALHAHLATELGFDASRPFVVGALTLIASPLFDPTRVIGASAPPPPPAIGPDVIVSGVGITIGKSGSVGVVSAYSMTTIACNIGDADASWIDCTSGGNCNQHPVIGQQMYRLKSVSGSTRFEQLGLSWLKHGFCADDAPNCGSPYVPNASCDWLGRFATDTYSYAMNASQPGMGARSEVQPWTGVYPYPPILGAGQSGDALFKRLQVRNADLDPAQNAGARYWGEIVYVTADEAQNAVRHNNYSCREIGVGSFFAGGYSLSFIAATAPQVSAIELWAQNDPGVTLSLVDVPGDGRLILGSKVTDLGAGQHHYEYALFNMNSDRAGRALEVPLPSGASCTNVGFHDVDYHSGEPYSNADWTPSVTPGASVAWACEAHSQNANANALRWGTTYNFRFDSDAPPTPGNVSLSLFKPGSPTVLTIPAPVPSGPACAFTSYCTTSTSTNGCSPQISAAGTPSASAASGFTLACALVDGQRSGLCFFGTAPAALPWGVGGTSTRCVATPLQRTPVQASGGTAGLCDGQFALDWNAWRTANPSGLGSPYSAGQSFYAQYWFRDPAAPLGTNLSNGMEFSTCP